LISLRKFRKRKKLKKNIPLSRWSSTMFLKRKRKTKLSHSESRTFLGDVTCLHSLKNDSKIYKTPSNAPITSRFKNDKKMP
jgi:hypothetical protein